LASSFLECRRSARDGVLVSAAAGQGAVTGTIANSHADGNGSTRIDAESTANAAP
jgi:hypothetical protein